MQELSLNVLDVAQNSVKAGAALIEISLLVSTVDDRLTIVIKDDGCGMDKAQLDSVTDPFYTTRTTRKVGLGVSFFKLAAEITGGSFSITSEKGAGTTVTAAFVLSSIDRMPLGDMCGSIHSLVIFNQRIDFVYRYQVDENEFVLDTREIKDVLEGAPLDSTEVSAYIKDLLTENTAEVNGGKQI